MKRFKISRTQGLTTFLMVIGLAAGLFANLNLTLAAPAFNNPAFAATWQRVDSPLEQLSNFKRGYTWGPQVIGSEAVTTENYNGGSRTVQYFDKARMEINNPGANQNDLYYVTTGLLVKEMVTGQRQDGDNSFTQLTPSTVQVAGDPNDNGQNMVAPTYASFASMVTFSGNQNSVAQATGSLITGRVDRAGNVTSFTPPEQRVVTGYDSVTQHNIADVFVFYGNQSGIIWNGTNFVPGPLFFNNPTYVLGRPVTEPYWTRAVVAGVEKDVLVQLFERRVLTYTPSNPDGYKVEMGNVGQHYFKWRYQQSTPVTPPTPAVTPTLQATSTTTTIGSQIGLVGSGFPANVTLELSGGAGNSSTDYGNIQTDTQGNFRDALNLTQPNLYSPGAWTFTVHTLDGQFSASVTITLLPAPDNAVLQSSNSTIAIGDLLTLNGSNFPANSTVGITGGTQSPGVNYGTAQTDNSGNFSQQIRLDQSNVAYVPGAWTFTATTLDGQADANVTVTLVAAGSPYLSLSANTLMTGSTLMLSGAGFPNYQNLTVQLRENGTLVANGYSFANPETDKRGQFSASVTLNKLPNGTTFTPDNYQVIVSNGNGSAQATAAFSLVASSPAPAIYFSPDTLRVGDTLNVNGSNFPASTLLRTTLFLNGQPLDGGDSFATPITDSNGNFTSLITFGTLPNGTPFQPGIYLVQVSNANNSAVASGTITLVPKQSVSSPTVTLSTQAIKIGGSITANGTGYAPNAKINLLLEQNGILLANGTPLAETTTDNNGNFSAKVVLKTLPDGTPLTPGVYQIEAVDSAIQVSSTATITLVSPS